MPNLKDIAATYYMDMVARRLSADDDTPDRATAETMESSSVLRDDLRRLLALAKEREALVERLREADANRAPIHQKLKSEWRGKQGEADKLRRKMRTLRTLLRKRRHVIRDLSGQLKATRKSLITVYGNPHMMSPQEASAAPPGGWWDALIRRILRRFESLHGLIWQSWMRLGVLRQFEARPVIPDRLPQPRLTVEKLPRISIVTPSYNQAAYLDQTMLSILDQNYPHLEYIVMDGGSADSSTEIIRRHESRLAHWQSAKDGGQADAVHQGLMKATGDIMAWLNSDDLIMPGTLAYVADYFARHPEVDVVYGHRIVINERGHEVARWVLPQHDAELLLWADFIPQETCFWRRSLHEKVGGIDPSFQFALDWDLLLRFQKAGARMVRLPYFMGAFRIHTEQKNAVTIRTDGYREMNLLRRRELGDEFNRGGLARRVNKAQFKALLLTWMLRFGIRL